MMCRVLPKNLPLHRSSPPSFRANTSVRDLRQPANHFPLTPDPDTMSIGEQKRQFALSREVIENKGRRKAILQAKAERLLKTDPLTQHP